MRWSSEGHHSTGLIRWNSEDGLCSRSTQAPGDQLELPPLWFSELSQPRAVETFGSEGGAGYRALPTEDFLGREVEAFGSEPGAVVQPSGYRLLPTEDFLGREVEALGSEGGTVESVAQPSGHRFLPTQDFLGSEMLPATAVTELVTPCWDCGLKFLQSATFQVLTVVSLISNSIVVGCETDMPELSVWADLEVGFVCLFSAELALRLFVYGIKGYFCGEAPKKFSTEQNNMSEVVWNIFDFILVCAGVINLTLQEPEGEDDATMLRTVRLFRLLRILRVFRVLRFLKPLYMLAYGFLEGALAVFWVAVLAAVAIYICAIVLVRVWRSYDGAPQATQEFFDGHFSNIPGAMLTLFELMASPSLENYRDVFMECPLFSAFTTGFVIFGSLGMNGLLTGVISESMLSKTQTRMQELQKEREVKRCVLEVYSEELFDTTVVDETGLNREQFQSIRKEIMRIVEEAGGHIPPTDFDQLFNAMDSCENGRIEKADFVHGLLDLCEDIQPMSIMELHAQVSRCRMKIDDLSTHASTVLQWLPKPTSCSHCGWKFHEEFQSTSRTRCGSTTREEEKRSTWSSCEDTAVVPVPANASASVWQQASSCLDEVWRLQWRLQAESERGSTQAADDLNRLGWVLRRLLNSNHEVPVDGPL